MFYWILTILVGIVGYVIYRQLNLHNLSIAIRYLRIALHGKEKSTIEFLNTYCIINYEYMGKMRHVLIPYSRRLIRIQGKYKVIAVYGDGITKDITQQPGMEYCITANDIGAIRIDVIKVETDDVVNSFMGYDAIVFPG